MAELSELLRQLRRSLGDVPHILELVRQGECLVRGDPKALCTLYQAAQNSFGPLQHQVSPESYGELSVKRLQALRQTDPEEAKVFYRFLAKYNIRQQDERVYRAGAELGLAVPRGVATAPPAPIPTASSKVLEPPAATAKAAARNSSTPIRPRSLRYSGCSEDTGRLTGFFDGGFPKDSFGDQAKSPISEWDDASMGVGAESVEWTRVTGLEALSPIQECESPKEQPQTNLFAELCAATEIATMPVVPGSSAVRSQVDVSTSLCADEKVPKTFFVNGVPYYKVKNLARGVTSKVCQVNTADGHIFALKRDIAKCSADFEALTNEVSLLMRLKDCPHVVRVFDAEVLHDERTILVVMECGDLDLAKYLQSAPDLDLSKIKVLLRQMLEAVQVIHDKKILHSDLKPANFLQVGQRLKLIDFGIARTIASNTVNISREESVGTVSYMAPEAAAVGVQPGSKIGRPSDVWSLGIIFYQMVYSRLPLGHLDPVRRFHALTDPQYMIEFPSDHSLQNHSELIKAQLQDVLGSCLQTDPRKRATIPELLEHPFLSNEEIKLERGNLEALMQSCFCTAKAAVCEGFPAEASADCEGWQVASDEVWQTLARKRSRAVHQDFYEGLDPFRRSLQIWLAESESKHKRHRTTEERCETSSSQSGGPVTAAFALSLSAPSFSISAPQATVSASESWKAMENDVLVRRPLAAISANTVSSRGAFCNPMICSELLQSQRSCLRKTATAAIGKENTPADGAVAKPENMVFRRLKERRALVVDDRDEFTQMGCWGPAA